MKGIINVGNAFLKLNQNGDKVITQNKNFEENKKKVIF